jgi:hypothetical protein
MPHALRVALLLCLCFPAAASAATLSFSFSGSIETVTDSDDFLDSSVAPSGLVSGTYDVDLATASGASPFTVGPAHLVFGLGSYGFDSSQDPHSISLINNTGPPGFPIDLWQSGSVVIPDLIGGTNFSGNFAGYQARIEFFDNSASQFDGTESAPIVPDDVVGWTQARLVLESLKDNGDSTTSFDGRVQVQVNLSSWSATPVPEPKSSALLALGLVSLALRARRRVRVR